MLLCEETIGYYPAHLFAATRVPQLVKPTAPVQAKAIESNLPPAVLAKVGSLEIPKNKAARRRLAQTIMDNVDKINKAKQFKSKGRALRSDMARAIKQVAK